ncbi:MAG TPA: polysaccharide pyruvyl transferase family protein [Jatrophihabitans sp.]|jgi:polysaccharide pyruvyl transferase WcaK-like protein
MPTIATIGAAYSANKGAASMMQSLLDNLPGKVPGVKVVAISTHPTADKRAYAAAGIDIEVVSQTPKDMITKQIPLAFLAGLLRVLRLPWRGLLRAPALRTIADADLVADLSGISFVDGRRPVVLVYNALVVWVPMALGTKVVKCSQAMGPFETPVNKALAKLTLPRLARVCPRGDVTEGFVRGLHVMGRGLKNVTAAGDMAFTMRVPDSVRESIAAKLAAAGPGPYLTISPSQVVATFLEGGEVDYPRVTAEFIDLVGERTGLRVVLIAHSAEPDKGVTHMNDLPICRDIAKLVKRPENLIFFDEDLLPTELRAIISQSQILVASRFHAMISALTERVPPVVIGWSHKYGEVLAPFGIQEAALDYSDLSSAAKIVGRVQDVLAAREDYVARIDANLPAAEAHSMVNFDVLAQELAQRESA